METVYKWIPAALGANAILILAALAISRLLLIRNRQGLRSIPGPFFASFLPFDRLISGARGNQYATHIKYHEKYGALVRIGPNHVSFSDGDALSRIYNINTKFHKSDFYRAFDAKTPKGVVPTVFSVRDEEVHKALKRPVASAWSMGTMVELEPLTDVCIKIFEDKLSALGGKEIDFGKWLHWYALDVIMSITFSNRMGFMEQERDIDGIIEAIEGRFVYNSVVGQAPYLHDYLLGSRVGGFIAGFVPALKKLDGARYIVKFAAKQLERYKQKDTEKLEYRDLLDRFKQYSEDGVVNDAVLLGRAAGIVFAGSDTTAISLRSVFYYLCKDARCYETLVREIDDMDRAGRLSDPITFAESNEMPYLLACIKEAMRMHPAVGMLLERVVPRGGVIIHRKYLPPGTIIGANPWVVGRDKDVYGVDADVFRPERWIESDKEHLKLMERNFLAFGGGARTCLGKNISLLEMQKLVPQILRRFKVDLVDQKRDWTLSDYWMVGQKGVICRVTKRHNDA